MYLQSSYLVVEVKFTSGDRSFPATGARCLEHLCDGCRSSCSSHLISSRVVSFSVSSSSHPPLGLFFPSISSLYFSLFSPSIGHHRLYIGAIFTLTANFVSPCNDLNISTTISHVSGGESNGRLPRVGTHFRSLISAQLIHPEAEVQPLRREPQQPCN